MDEIISGSDSLIPGLIDQVVVATGQGHEAVALALDGVVPALRGELPIREARRLLEALRNGRYFVALSRAADAMLDGGVNHPYVRRQYAQALIEQGQFKLAVTLLLQLLADLAPSETVEKSEALGLLGRLYKQRFVQAQGDRERAARELNASIGYYASAYELDPEWHGANLVALVRRAERDNIALLNHESSRAIAERLLLDLRRKEQWSAWTHASAGEAFLALESWQAAKDSYTRFLREPGLSGFAIAGAARQLREIWCFEPDDSEPSGAILAALQSRILSAPGGGEFSSSPAQLASLNSALKRAQGTQGEGALEAILGDEAPITLRTCLNLMGVASLVGNVVDRRARALNRVSGGTGFLVDGGAFSTHWHGRPLILTNHHVLSEDGEPPSVPVDHADITFAFWEREVRVQTFAIEKILARSTRGNCDCTLASLRNPPAKTDLLPLSLSRGALGPRGAKPPARVYLVGYPQGRGLEFSTSDNHVVDHELGEQHLPRGHARIHYRAPTEAGMSGSPVLDSLECRVVGLHRMGQASPMRAVEGPGPYRANEAVWIQSVVAALTSELAAPA